MGKLVFLIRGPKRTARLNLEGPFFLVGRGEPFPVFHDDPTLSREHAAVVDTPDGFLVKDLGSRNGVTVNGERVDRYGEVPFSPGDMLQAGNTQITLVEVTALERSRATEEKPITVDAEGQTGLQPIPTPAEPDEIEGEVTGELTPPEGLIGLHTELSIEEEEEILDLVDDDDLTIPEEQLGLMPLQVEEEAFSLDEDDDDPDLEALPTNEDLGGAEELLEE